ncbi:MAG TPA: 30S ribosomal protein S1 [Verrucomicrobiae bacterium]|jgi:small subunit ribosomal protein S1|nr:30S ribosomal protein S1 [Verrucomicrobiae bacterium]
MFSDNDNSGAELSAGQPSTAAAAAQDPSANDAEQSVVVAVQAPEPASVVTTPPPPEPAVVTLPGAGSEPVAAPDGKAAVEHSNVSEAMEAATDSGEPTAESTAEMEQLMEQYAAPHQAPAEGEIESGQVVAITDLGVVVNLGAKTEGLIPAQEFAELDGPFPLQVGQPVEVQRTGDRKEGMVLLSYQRVKRRRAWGKIEEAYRAKSDITGKVVDNIKGGLVVDIGVRAFLPASQADVHPVRDLDEWKGRELTVRVLKMNRKRGNVVVSRRAIMDEQVASQRQAMLDSLAEGQTVRGVVKNVTGYGAFVDLGGIDGLLHITDMSWGRVASPLDAVSPGEEVEVKILKYDKEKGRVSLGRKQLLPDPWASVVERYAQGTKLSGKIMGLTDYGAFVELEPGIEGLVHVSEMSWSKRKQHPSKMVKVGDEVEVIVLGVDSNERRISLGMKQAQSDPWQQLAEKYPVGTVVSGKIRNLTEFGAFLEIEEGFDGLIHVSDISWTGRIKNPSEVYKKGDVVEAKVLKIDQGSRRVSLGVKQVNDIWSSWFEKHKVGDLVRGKVSRVTTFGAFVELADGIEGLCHISEIDDRKKGDKAQAPPRPGVRQSGLLDPGRDYEFKIVKIAQDQHKIGLSYRGAQKQAERRDMEDYRSSKPSAKATIGDAIMAKRSL